MSETIAAVSTAPGAGGIGIVRISGERASVILSELFVPRCDAFLDRQMIYGHIREPRSGETVDEVLVVFMKGPKSYTGEDVAEIQAHGGSVPLRRILSLVYEAGAMPAAPGEFTKRAFLNGRIDLIQAGAVVDLIRSETDRGYAAARMQTDGFLSQRIREIRERLLSLLADITARIEYPEAFEAEENEETSEKVGKEVAGGETETEREMHAGTGGGLGTGEMMDGLDAALEMLARLSESAKIGRIIQNGIRVVILGKPNVGKSSLMNAIAGYEAAIVTDIPGTTRDAIEVKIDLHGIPIVLSDTAGIREGADTIEMMGIEKSKQRYENAEIALVMLDASERLTDEDVCVAAMLNPEKRTFVLLNKQDLPTVVTEDEARNLIPFAAVVEKMSLADVESAGAVKKIAQRIEEIVLGGAGEGMLAGEAGTYASLLVTKATHERMLAEATMEVNEARNVIALGEAPEFAEINIRAAFDILGEMLGETVTDDILDRVFEDFCVGK